MPTRSTKSSPVEHPTPHQRGAAGKAARSAVPRSSFGSWEPSSDRPDPVSLLEAQEASRVADLVPIRHGRMAASPFAFYRGAANVLAADLSTMPRTPLTVQLCGDAHLVNFGGFASPERNLVFDVNDFDETLPGPFEWDVMRLAASIEVAARAREFDEATCTKIVTAAIRSYREAMRSFAQLSNLDVWYSRLAAVDVEARSPEGVGRAVLKNLQKAIEKAESKDRLKAKAKLTEMIDGELRFRSDPPLLEPVEELFGEHDADFIQQTVHSALRAYRRTLTGDRRHLLESYRAVQLARKVVGVGSVGTRCWVALLVGRDNDDPLFLQVKEAESSVLEPYLGKSKLRNHGRRVVEGQRLMQAAADIFLGWERVDGVDGRTHDYYMRQLWDWKASANIETMDPASMGVYVDICGWTLARAHARSGDRIAIAAYLGTSTTFDKAMAGFASRYADQNDRDHRALTDAIAGGRIEATSGI